MNDTPAELEAVRATHARRRRADMLEAARAAEDAAFAEIGGASMDAVRRDLQDAGAA